MRFPRSSIVTRGPWTRGAPRSSVIARSRPRPRRTAGERDRPRQRLAPLAARDEALDLGVRQVTLPLAPHAILIAIEHVLEPVDLSPFDERARFPLEVPGERVGVGGVRRIAQRLELSRRLEEIEPRRRARRPLASHRQREERSLLPRGLAHRRALPAPATPPARRAVAACRCPARRRRGAASRARPRRGARPRPTSATPAADPLRARRGGLPRPLRALFRRVDRRRSWGSMGRAGGTGRSSYMRPQTTTREPRGPCGTERSLDGAGRVMDSLLAGPVLPPGSALPAPLRGRTDGELEPPW